MIPAPYQHQVDALAATSQLEFWFCSWEMGMGKSRLLIETAWSLHSNGKINAVLYLSDKGCYRGFLNEIHKYSVMAFEYAIWSEGTIKLRSGSRPVKPHLYFLLMNIEAMSTKKGFEEAERFCKRHKALMIVDESTSIKTPGSKRTKAVLKLGRLSPYRRTATGSPMPNGPLDLYSQYEFLKPGLLGFPSFVVFKAYYCIQKSIDVGTHKFNKVVGYRYMDELQASIKPHTGRLLKSDCLDLPDKIYETIEVEQTEEQREAYEKLQEEALLHLGSGLLTITHALTLIGKLHQINCGHVKDDQGITNRIPSNRIRSLLDTVEKIDGKTIIWGVYREDMVLLAESLSKMGELYPVFYHGEVGSEERQDALQRFTSDPKCRWFVGTPASGGKGLNGLTVASHCIYYSNSYNLEHRLQSEDRLHRIGQKNCVTYVDLICPGTIDVKIVRALKAKKNLSQMVLGDLREMIK